MDIKEARKVYKKLGDIGLVAKHKKVNRFIKPKPLTVPGVLKSFLEIALTEGKSVGLGIVLLMLDD